MDPVRLRSRLPLVVPEKLGLVLYCSSSGELIGARVAVALRKKRYLESLGSRGRAYGMEERRSTSNLSVEYVRKGSGTLRYRDNWK
jgi:hypothetical protein